MNQQPENENQNSDTSSDGQLTLLQLVGSALAAGFGVQSSRNRERDFSRGKPMQFIIIGVTLTVLFVLAVAGVVNLVLSNVS